MPISFTSERLILCEGSSDKTFFCELIKKRGLPGCDVHFPLHATEETGGVDKFGHFLLGNINEEFLTTVKGVLVVADNDDDQAEQFSKVQQQLKKAGYGIPGEPLKAVKSPNGLPNVAVMMLPLDGRPGNLESICIEAALSKWPHLREPLANYLGSTDVVNWRVGKQDKMRIQCIIAATCEKNPYSTLSTLYQKPEQYHIPLDALCLDEIAGVLQNFDSMIAST